MNESSLYHGHSLFTIHRSSTIFRKLRQDKAFLISIYFLVLFQLIIIVNAFKSKLTEEMKFDIPKTQIKSTSNFYYSNDKQ